MRPAARDWLDGLRRFSAEHRLSGPKGPEPVPVETGAGRRARSGSPLALAAQTALLAAHAADWGARILEGLASECPDFALVFTTSPPGLAAVDDLIGRLPPESRDRVAAATEIEYRGWCMRSPDEAHALHAVVWSWIKAPLPPQRRADFIPFPIAADADYWVLRYGHAGGLPGDHGADLYGWDGATATLLARGIVERFHPRG